MAYVRLPILLQHGTPEPLSPSGPPLVTDWAAVSVTAASETSVTATAVVASAAVAVAITNEDDHLRDGHGMDDRLHDGYDDMIVVNGSPLLSFLSNNEEENAFPTRHAPSNPDAVATTTATTTADRAIDDEHDDSYNVWIHSPPQPTAVGRHEQVYRNHAKASFHVICHF